MARPRVIKLKDGEVSLSGFPKEVADQLQAHILCFGSGTSEPTIIIPTGVPLEPVNPHAGSSFDSFMTSSPVLSSRAVGVLEEAGKYSVVTVAYDAHSRAAEVESVEPAINRTDASTKFKVKADKLKFVI